MRNRQYRRASRYDGAADLHDFPKRGVARICESEGGRKGMKTMYMDRRSEKISSANLLVISDSSPANARNNSSTTTTSGSEAAGRTGGSGRRSAKGT